MGTPPKVEPAAVDGPRLRALLKQVEMVAHRGGWDKPPELYGIYDVREHPDTDQWLGQVLPANRWPTARRDGYLAKAFIPQRIWPDGNPPDVLRRMAVNFTVASTHPETAAMIDLIGSPGLLGLAFQCESWAHRYTGDELAKRDPTVLLADTPGSVEARMVWATDVAGHQLAAMRDRGQAPRVFTTSPDGSAVDGVLCRDVNGYVIDSLRAIVGAVLGNPRPDLLPEVQPVGP